MWNESLLRAPRHQFAFHHLIPYLTLNEISPIFTKIPFATLADAVVFDVGANHGIWTAAFVHAAGHKTREIHMFEPMVGNLRIINANIAEGLYQGHEDLLKVNPIAISDHQGAAEIHFDTLASTLASLDNDHCYLPGRRVPMETTQKVKLDTLDIYCETHGIVAIDVLKIDVEGHELPVLNGAQGLFRQRKVACCLFEFGPHQLGRRERFKDFFDFFEAHGYALFHIHGALANVRPIPVYGVAYEQFGQVSMFMAIRGETAPD